MRALKVFFIILCMIHADSFAKENKILIKINNNIITSYDLLAEINYLKTINDDFRKLDLEKSIEIAKFFDKRKN